MEILFKTLQLLLSLSILVIVHELGHFAFARLFKTRVEKFYLFFNAWFSLAKCKVVNGKRKWYFFTKNSDTEGEDNTKTEYGIGWIPLGGYVKISGMIDESMDKEQLKLPPQPWEFRSKPAWQRLLIMVGGVLVNFIFAVVIYIGILFYWGEEYLPTANVKYGIMVDSLGKQMGFKNGDKIISVSNKKVESFDRIIAEMVLNNPKTVQVIRDSAEAEIKIHDSIMPKILSREVPFLSPRVPFVIGGFSENSPAFKAGIREGDKIVKLNEDTIVFFDEMVSRLKNYKNQTVKIKVLRDTKTFEYSVTVSEIGFIGVMHAPYSKFFDFKKVDYGFFGSIPAGIKKGFREINDYLKQLKLIFSPETGAYKSLGGFVAIGKHFPSAWDSYFFWRITALLSIMLAIINILPIPALDGGHVLFLLYEIVTRRKPSEKFLEYAQITGMILLLGLVLYANGNDIVKLFK